eukprot:2413189-Pleurochrysis_carterae.AAC.1
MWCLNRRERGAHRSSRRGRRAASGARQHLRARLQPRRRMDNGTLTFADARSHTRNRTRSRTPGTPCTRSVLHADDVTS